MTSAQLTGLLATVGAAFLAQAIVCASLYRQVRRLSSRQGPGDPAPGDPVPIAARFQTLEARLSRIEASVTNDQRATSAPEAKRGRRLDRRQVASADGPVLIAVPNLAVPAPDPSTTAEAAAELGRRFGGIWGLADAGAPLDEIARETGFPVGQVELILGLRRSRPGGAGTNVGPIRGETDA